MISASNNALDPHPIYDGSLRCDWKVAREGAGLVRFVGESVVLE